MKFQKIKNKILTKIQAFIALHRFLGYYLNIPLLHEDNLQQLTLTKLVTVDRHT
jgi:hypothetical protein